MTRDFLTDPVDSGLVDRLCDLARRSPSAGNTQSVAFLVLTGDDVAEYWAVTLPPERRDRFPWPGLLRAPVLILPWVDPDDYVSRYAESDKAATGLGARTGAWTTPYWWVDGGMAAMALLLAAEAEGLGALFFGVFEHEDAVRRRFGVPATRRVVGAVALGYAAPDQRASGSASRRRAPLGDVVHRGRWRPSPAGTSQYSPEPD